MILTETNIKLDRPLDGRGKPMRIVGESETNSGVAVMYELTKIKEIQMTKPRILQLTLENDIHIVGAYGPNEHAPQFQKLIFWNGIRTILSESTKTHTATILIGDLNAGHEPLVHKRNPNQETNYEKLQWATENIPFKVIPTPPTWKSDKSNRATRTLDRCLIHSKTDFVATATLDWEDNLSDHAVLVVNVNFNEIDRNIGRPRSLTFIEEETQIDLKWKDTKARLKKLTSPLESDTQIPLKRFWEALKEHRNNERKPLTIIDEAGTTLDPHQAVEACANYLRTVWNRAASHDIIFTANNNESQPPTAEEISKSIQELKNDTALGRDKIPSNLLKGSDIAIEEYQKFLTILWKSPKELPKEWKDMKVRPIPKKDSRTLPVGARPVTCLATSTKILNKIISTRNQRNYENALHEDVHAYRNHRSTWTAIASLLSEISQHEKCVVTFLDMSKAFDCVTRQALQNALNRWNLPRNEAELVIAQYTNCKVYVELNGATATPFLHTNGIRQGCTLSGILWNLVTSQIHFNLSTIFPGKRHKILSYADDVIIITKNKIDAQILKSTIRKELAEVGLSLNDSKEIIKEFHIGAEDNTPTEWLGLALVGNLTWDFETDCRVKKATDASKLVRKLIRENDIKLGTKLTIDILRSTVSCHLTNGNSIIKFNQDQIRMMINVMAEAILENTHIAARPADRIAQAIFENRDVEISENDLDNMTHTDISTRGEQPLQTDHVTSLNNDSEIRITPTDSMTNISVIRKSSSTRTKARRQQLHTTQAEAVFVNPTQEEIKRRQKLIKDLQEKRSWCNHCNPPYQIKNVTNRNRHRLEEHGLGPEKILEILCSSCNRTVASTGYAKHLCIDPTKKRTDLIPCPFCQNAFTKFGIQNHKAKCSSKK